MARVTKAKRPGQKSSTARRRAGTKKKAADGAANFMEVAPSPVVSKPAAGDENAKRVAVIHCVNGALDANRPGWNSDGQGDGRTMDKDLHYDVHSIPAFLGVVSRCLAPNYTLTIDTPLVQACISAAVGTAKFLIFKNTK